MDIERILDESKDVSNEIGRVVDSYNLAVKSRIKELVVTYENLLDMNVFDVSDEKGFKTRYEYNGKSFVCGLNNSELFVDSII